MSADIIQFVPRPNPNRDNQALEIYNIGLIQPDEARIIPVTCEDTAPSEMNPDTPA